MPKQISIYDNKSFEMVLSKREYTEFSILATEYTESSYERVKHHPLSLFVDVLTGVVVTDVAAYEASLPGGAS